MHAYTNDQKIDNYHSETEEGEVIKYTNKIPVDGKLTGSAFKMAILNLQLSQSVTREELNEFLRYGATFNNKLYGINRSGQMSRQSSCSYSEPPLCQVMWCFIVGM